MVLFITSVRVFGCSSVQIPLLSALGAEQRATAGPRQEGYARSEVFLQGAGSKLCRGLVGPRVVGYPDRLRDLDLKKSAGTLPGVSSAARTSAALLSGQSTMAVGLAIAAGSGLGYCPPLRFPDQHLPRYAVAPASRHARSRGRARARWSLHG